MVLFLLHRGTASLYPTGTPSPRSLKRTPCHARFARRIVLAGAASSFFGVGASSCGVSASSSSGSGLGMSWAGVMASSSGSPGPSSSHAASAERAAANKSTRGGPEDAQHGRFLGGRCLWSILRGDALGLQPASRVRCGRVPFGCAGSVFAFLTRGAGVNFFKTGFLNVENIWGKFGVCPFSQRCLHCCDDVARDPKHLSLSSG